MIPKFNKGLKYLIHDFNTDIIPFKGYQIVGDEGDEVNLNYISPEFNKFNDYGNGKFKNKYEVEKKMS